MNQCAQRDVEEGRRKKGERERERKREGIEDQINHCTIHSHGTGGGGSGSHCRLFSPDQSEGLPLFVETLTENSPEIEREGEK